MDPELGEFLAITLTVLTGSVVVIRLAFAAARRLEAKSKSPQMPSDLAARLERIEHAIDSVAIEVERISEGQRFTTKMLSERAAHPPLDKG